MKPKYKESSTNKLGQLDKTVTFRNLASRSRNVDVSCTQWVNISMNQDHVVSNPSASTCQDYDYGMKQKSLDDKNWSPEGCRQIEKYQPVNRKKRKREKGQAKQNEMISRKESGY